MVQVSEQDFVRQGEGGRAPAAGARWRFSAFAPWSPPACAGWGVFSFLLSVLPLGLVPPSDEPPPPKKKKIIELKYSQDTNILDSIDPLTAPGKFGTVTEAATRLRLTQSA